MKLVTLEDYKAAYKKELKAVLAEHKGKQVRFVRPEIWIYCKWSTEQGIKAIADDDYNAKMKIEEEQRRDLAKVLRVGEAMMALSAWREDNKENNNDNQ